MIFWHWHVSPLSNVNYASSTMSCDERKVSSYIRIKFDRGKQKQWTKLTKSDKQKNVHTLILPFAFNRACLFFKGDSSQTTVSTGPMKMFRLEHETVNVCHRNVVRFAHVECRFHKIKDMFQGFRSLMSLRLQRDGGTKSKQIWTNLSHWNTGARQPKLLL